VKTHGTGYDNTYGSDVFREVVAEQYWQLDPALGWGPENIVVGVGGRDALVKAYDAMQHLGTGRIGDVVLTSRVPWVSYNWGPYGVGANVLLAPGDEADAWQYTPEGIAASVEFARQCGGRQIAGIIITSPDNPTGKVVPVERQIELGKTALELGIPFVLYDWIYHYITEGDPIDINAVLGAFSPEDRKRLMILDGITKSLGGSNVRNAHVLADAPVIKFMSKRAAYSSIPQFHGQAVMIAAVELGFGNAAAAIIQPTNASRQIVRDFLAENHYHHIIGDGGYYAFINVARWKEAGGFESSFDLGEYLTGEHGIAIVPGDTFSREGDDWVRFSYALPPEVTRGALQRFHEGLAALE
ncbi:MAG: pyridoxal phosphate-dependent aminotransferase, partial [Chloroflexi bacterium]|nr:pyridoxal phosphate-dependent aminotransferase [Chloroflexota bacterium]